MVRAGRTPWNASLLLDTYLKKTTEEKLASLERNNNVWVKPLQNWLKSVNSICKIIKSGDLLAQKAYLSEIYGSNLFLQNKTIIAVDDKTANAVSQKHLFERVQKGVFWSLFWA